MKFLIVVVAIMLPGCSSVKPCSTQSLKFQVPSGVPFMGNAPFVIERSNQHVDCERDPNERQIDE